MEICLKATETEYIACSKGFIFQIRSSHQQRKIGIGFPWPKSLYVPGSPAYQYQFLWRHQKKKEFQTKVGNSNMRESDEQIKPKLCFVSHWQYSVPYYLSIYHLAISGTCMDRIKINFIPLFSKMPTRRSSKSWYYPIANGHKLSSLQQLK